MAGSFPRPPINEIKLDTSTMHYVRDGGFEESDIGAIRPGLPKDVSDGQSTLKIKHVDGKL